MEKLWKRKSSEKTISASNKSNGEETCRAERVAELERFMEDLEEKLSSALSQCKVKEDLATINAQATQEALAGWEKTKAEAESLKQNLDKALQQRVIAEERISHLDAALKECMQQLRFVREEQEQRIHDAVLKTTREQQKVQNVLKEKLAESEKSCSKLGAENTHFITAIQMKDKLIEELKERKAQEEADFNALRAKLDSVQKDNSSMNYELHMLEKELEIRNEEREFHRFSTDASHKQHLESVKKIAKLETECQRLRLLVQKRLPGPAAFARMKNEVDMLGKNPAATTRNKMIPSLGDSMVKDFPQRNSPEKSPSKKVNYLMERLSNLEEENKTLKEEMSKKSTELESSRITCERTVFKLSHVEAQLAELSKGQTTMEMPKSILPSRRLSFASESEINAREGAESWASLSSELANFRNGKPRGSPSCKTVGSSDIDLMDDFVEMEKLAIVCVDKSHGDPHVNSEGNSPLETKSEASLSDATGKELIPITENHSAFTEELPPTRIFGGKYPSWLQDILTAILEQNRVTLRSLEEIIGDVKVALAHTSGTIHGDVTEEKEQTNFSSPAKLPHSSGYISSRPPNSTPLVDSFNPVSGTGVCSTEISTRKLQSGLNESISKIIELIERINQQSSKDLSSEQIYSEDDGSYRNPLTPSGYTYRAFQWKSTELNHVLRQFVHTCNDLLDGKAEFESFAIQLTSTFEWIMNHCFSLQDVSSMRDTIKKRFDWDESQSESEHGIGINSQYSEREKLQATDELSSWLASSAASNAKNHVYQGEEMLSNLNEEIRRLKDELTKVESAKKDLEVKLQSATDKIEALLIKLKNSESSTANLQTELLTLKASKGKIEDQMKKNKFLNEDLNKQVNVVRVELNEVRQKFSSLEVELEERINSCHDLETTCLEQQLQLESVTPNDLMHGAEQKKRQLQNGWEISNASEKLAECQETILNLGKQLKALASPKEAVVLDKVISVTPTISDDNSNKSYRSSLLNHILTDNVSDPDNLASPEKKEIISTTDSQRTPGSISKGYNDVHAPYKPSEPLKQLPPSNEIQHNSTAGWSLAIVPSKNRGGGISLLRKLLSRRKKDTSNRMSLPLIA
ncbi:Filament-like plant protein [Thalictrum thalictroides]|uniref:Filament-like plant protein n=1 Tax=Thalictrum thalictroides TaxID=46969 RepID=A0A7J6V2X3_THATH|nr:Filament-like plant protein [Thalictrum thalictroides]